MRNSAIASQKENGRLSKIKPLNSRVKKIVSIEPYRIDAVWSNDEVGRIDFAKFLAEYFEKNSIYFKILNEVSSCKAKTDGRTIYWEGIVEMKDYGYFPV